MKRGIFRYDIGRFIGRSSADHRPITKTQKLSADVKKSYNKVVIIFFCRPMIKELKSGILSADGRPTVGGVNVIADLVIPIFNF